MWPGSAISCAWPRPPAGVRYSSVRHAIEQVLEAARREKADLVGVSYRLTPETGERLLGQFAEAASELHEAGVRFAFGGTPPVAERARLLGFFERVFDGSEPPEAVLAYLKGQTAVASQRNRFPP